MKSSRLALAAGGFLARSRTRNISLRDVMAKSLWLAKQGRAMGRARQPCGDRDP
jgi:hypothetical protein